MTVHAARFTDPRRQLYRTYQEWLADIVREHPKSSERLAIAEKYERAIPTAPPDWGEALGIMAELLRGQP